MRKLWLTSIIVAVNTTCALAQVVFAGYADFKRVNSASCYQEVEHQYNFNIYANHLVGFDSMHLVSQDTTKAVFGQNWASEPINHGVTRYSKQYSSSLNGGCGQTNSANLLVPFELSEGVELRNDTSWFGYMGVRPVITRFPEHEYDTSNGSNVAVPLLVRSGEPFRFNPINQLPTGTGQNGHVTYPGIGALPKETRVNNYSGEIIFNVNEPGVYIYGHVFRDMKQKTQDLTHVARIQFFTINVVDSNIPTGYVSAVAGESIHPDSFITYGYIPDTAGSVDISFRLKQADSARFSIAAGKDYYEGVSLEQIVREDSTYHMKMHYTKESRIITEGRSHINVLVKQFLNGRPYYSTFTVGFAPQEPVGNGQFEEIDGLSIYPNPSTGPVNIEGLAQASSHILKVSDLAGRTVIERYLENGASKLVFNLPKGCYLVRLENDENAALMIRKIIIK